MTSIIDGDSVTSDPTSINDTNSPYTTQGSDIIHVDTTNGPVTVELSSDDLDNEGFDPIIRDVGGNASTNNITVTTAGPELINPGSNSSVVIDQDGGHVEVESNGENWWSNRALGVDELTLAGNRLDSDGDGILENADVDALTNFGASDTFTGYPLGDTDVNINGGYSTVSTVTSNYTASDRDLINVDASGGNVIVTLPAPEDGLLVNVKKVDSSSNTVTIATPNTETIDGQSSLEITSQYTGREIYSDGSNFFNK